MTDTSRVSVDEAASVLQLPVPSVEALVGAGYLSNASPDTDAITIALADLKAFMARNTDSSAAQSIEEVLGQVETTSHDPGIDAETFLDAIEDRSTEMARRTLDIFSTVFGETETWSPRRRQAFVDDAADRFDAIIAVARQGDRVDNSLLGDLATVGETAAMTGSTLPEVLLTLRISRDLMVQTAIDVAGERGRPGGIALSIVLTQILPAMDRLTDAVARGYWSAVVRREEESWARYEHVVENSSDGVYEIDVDGHFTYANPSLGLITGIDPTELEGRPYADALVLTDDDEPSEIFGEPGRWRDVSIRRADGVNRTVQVKVTERTHDGQLVGYDGVVRDITAERDLEYQKNEFLAFVTHELRQPVSTVLGLGITLSSYADELKPERVSRIGRTIHQQAERIARLADDLFDISRIQADSLMLNPRELDLLEVVTAATTIVDQADEVTVRVPNDLTVRADARRLEQVVAHLVENAARHGEPPVVVTASRRDGSIELRIVDHGPGLAEGQGSTVFDHLAPTAFIRQNRRGAGLGLPLARGLIEAMGGRIRYEPNPAGGAEFVVDLLAAR